MQQSIMLKHVSPAGTHPRSRVDCPHRCTPSRNSRRHLDRIAVFVFAGLGGLVFSGHAVHAVVAGCGHLTSTHQPLDIFGPSSTLPGLTVRLPACIEDDTTRSQFSGPERQACIAHSLNSLISTVHPPNPGVSVCIASALVDTGILDDCHGIAHATGTWLWSNATTSHTAPLATDRAIMEASEVLALCPSGCVDGCAHGVLTQMVRAGVALHGHNVTALRSLFHGVCDGPAASRLGGCEAYSLNHGIGHGLGAVLRDGAPSNDATFASMRALCAATPHDESACFTGLMMQYADDAIASAMGYDDAGLPTLDLPRGIGPICHGFDSESDRTACGDVMGEGLMFATCHDLTSASDVCHAGDGAEPSSAMLACETGAANEGAFVARQHPQGTDIASSFGVCVVESSSARQPDASTDNVGDLVHDFFRVTDCGSQVDPSNSVNVGCCGDGACTWMENETTCLADCAVSASTDDNDSVLTTTSTTDTALARVSTTPLAPAPTHAPTPSGEALGCCVAYGYGAMMAPCCHRFTDGVQASACSLPSGTVGGAMRFHSATPCDAVRDLYILTTPSPPKLDGGGVGSTERPSTRAGVEVEPTVSDAAPPDVDMALDNGRCRVIASHLPFCGEHVVYPTAMTAKRAKKLDMFLSHKFQTLQETLVGASSDTHAVTVCTAALARELCLQAFPACEGAADIPYCWRGDATRDEGCAVPFVCPIEGGVLTSSPIVCAPWVPGACVGEGGSGTTASVCASVLRVDDDATIAVDGCRNDVRTSTCATFGKTNTRCFERVIRRTQAGAPVAREEVIVVSGGHVEDTAGAGTNTVMPSRVLWTTALSAETVYEGGAQPRPTGTNTDAPPVRMFAPVAGALLVAVVILATVAFRLRRSAVVRQSGGAYHEVQNEMFGDVSSDEDEGNEIDCDFHTAGERLSPEDVATRDAARRDVTARLKQAAAQDALPHPGSEVRTHVD
eukprot:m.22159 g.22159  ORF g.22159 m.22159 type:complete len:962 (-) comp3963_c0_seq1:97-2982(-)